MYTSKAVVFLALGACASAVHFPDLLPRKTAANYQAEETTSTSSSSECSSRVQSWASAFPTSPPDLSKVLASQGSVGGSVTDLCEVAVGLPKTQAAAFTAYFDEVYSYFSKQSSNMNVLATKCPDEMGAPASIITSQLDEVLSIYSSFAVDGCEDTPATTTTGGVSTTFGKGSPVRGSAATSTASATDFVANSASATSSGATTIITTTSASSSTTASDSGASTTASGSSAASSSSSSSSSSATTVPDSAGARQSGMFATAVLAACLVGSAVLI
ncbi:uncharacterized protein GGS25DRAFT_195590 [Hypoxylon fragiforme]|uniref:uncharacterized protein n=1 Tax=Hypoxylon fragiforme TaxID=63214 RepID=UPI0020C65304|nr:uncharacterized protein GGS25DRAFT_195590 [Hypoxylon fragiforme]KAI2611424.1 hypothetical protein GGS25DRAFT_195590 [Hypoxylon fragiforme]